MSNVKKASVSEYSSAAITKKGELYVWGSNVDGSLAGGTDKYILKPRKIMDNVVDVSLGRDSSACLTKNGDLYTWGNNYDHSLGDNETFRTKPKKIMKDVVQINSAWLAVIALKKTGDLYVWGGNFFSSKPKKIMSNVVSAACRDNSVCAIKKNGSLYYKMYNSKKAKKIMSKVSSVYCAKYNNGNIAVITQNGDLYLSCPDNTYGQLGDGTKYDDSTYDFNEVNLKKIMSDVISADLSGNTSGAITRKGKIYLWGLCKIHMGKKDKYGTQTIYGTEVLKPKEVKRKKSK